MMLPDKMRTIDSSSYIKVLNSTLEAFTKKDFGYEIATKIGLLSLLQLIICDMHIYNYDRHFSINSDKIASCIQYIYENFDKEINFSAFASSLGFSPNYFRKLFKQTTRKSPTEFIIDLRIDKAVELILNGKNTVSEISQLVGYEDLHYFSKLFKQKKGFSPSNYIENKIVK
jgi:AraC-like DNA-binding protein